MRYVYNTVQDKCNIYDDAGRFRGFMPRGTFDKFTLPGQRRVRCRPRTAETPVVIPTHAYEPGKAPGTYSAPTTTVAAKRVTMPSPRVTIRPTGALATIIEKKAREAIQSGVPPSGPLAEAIKKRATEITQAVAREAAPDMWAQIKPYLPYIAGVGALFFLLPMLTKAR